MEGDPPLGRRHIAVLAQVGGVGRQTVGELAHALGLSLPAASKLTTELAQHSLVQRSEDAGDRRRTVVELDPKTERRVREWLERRNGPLETALAALSAEERHAFLKGLTALADALMEESRCGSVRPHHRASHRRRSNPDRSV